MVTFHCFNSDIYGEKQNPHSLSRTSIQTRQEDVHYFFNQLYPFTYTEHKLWLTEQKHNSYNQRFANSNL